MSQLVQNEDGEMAQAMLLSPELVTVISAWCGGRVVEEIDPFDSQTRQPGINVQCQDEVKRASLGDYVVKHNDGSFDVYKPNAFKHSYTNLGV